MKLSTLVLGLVLAGCAPEAVRSGATSESGESASPTEAGEPSVVPATDDLAEELSDPESFSEAMAELSERVAELGQEPQGEQFAQLRRYAAPLATGLLRAHKSLEPADRRKALSLLVTLRDSSADEVFALVIGDFGGSTWSSEESVLALKGACIVPGPKVSKALKQMFVKLDPEHDAFKPLAEDFPSAVAAVVDAGWASALIKKLQPEMKAPIGIAPDKRVSAEYRRQVFLQKTAARALGTLRTEKAVDPLLRVLLDPAKEPVHLTALASLVEIGTPAIGRAEALLQGDEALVAHARERHEKVGPMPRHYSPTLVVGAHVVGEIGRSEGRDVLLGALKDAASPVDRAFIATELLRVPLSDESWAAVQQVFLSTPVKANFPSGKGALEAVTEALGDTLASEHVPWLLASYPRVRGGGYRKRELSHIAMFNAARLMQPPQVAAVEKAIMRSGNKNEVSALKQSKQLFQRCQDKLDCYFEQLIDRQHQSPERSFTAVKAALMVASLGDAGDRQRLIGALDDVQDPAARAAVATAIEALSPQGSLQMADALEAQLDGEETARERDFALWRTVRRLRARARE